MRKTTGLAIWLGVLAVVVSNAGVAQLTDGVPSQNVNVIGPTPGEPPPFTPANPLFFPDNGIRQQNEPSCAFKPASPLEVICAFNDYRGASDPRVGDAWQGVAESHNGGYSWISRLAPGWKDYGLPDPALNQYALGMDFAADPTVVTAPGVMVLNFIAAERDDNGVGGIYVQRWHEVNNETGFNWQPEPESRLIDSGTAGRFIDKPFMLLNLLPPGSGTVTVSGTLEDGSLNSVQVPAGELTVAYAVFVGSQQNGTKILVSQSSDYGDTWSNPTKLTETLNLNQGVSLSAMGNKMIAVWRQVADSNNGHNIAYAISNNRGVSWGKAKILAQDFCPFDQQTSVSSFRTTSFPVITHDGSDFQVFWAARNFAPEASDNSCLTGVSRIVMSTSATGNNWSAPVAIDPINDGDPDASVDAFQFMPSASTALGRTQVIWYDTRYDRANESAEFIVDSFDQNLNRYRLHTAAVRGMQIINGAVPDASVQVSRYQVGFANVNPAAPGSEELVQLENNFLNMRLFANGQIPFVGDYIWSTAEPFRLDGNGDWIPNNGPIPGGLNETSFLAAWADNRNVRGNVWGDISNATPTPYSSTAAPLQSEIDDTIPLPCVPGGGLTGTRAADVYSSVIEPGVVLASPAPIKQLGGIVPQRAYVLTLSNNTNADVTYDLEITETPADPATRVSFSQFPIDGGPEPLVAIPVPLVANSTAVRTLYINSELQLPQVKVVVKQGATLLDEVIINGNPLAPTVQDPNGDILGAEVYDPFIVTKVVASYTNPNLQNPNYENPNLENPNYENPNYENPNYENPNLQNPNYQNPNLENPNFENPNFENVTVQYPNLENPNLENSAFTDGATDSYTDITWEVSNTANTTTGYDVAAFSSIDPEQLENAQFIATRTYATPTVTSDCQVAPVAQNQVLFSILNPNLQNPNLQNPNYQNSAFTDGSVFMAPGETLHFTLRLPGTFVPPEDSEEFGDQFGFKIRAQPFNPDEVFDIDDPLGPAISGPGGAVTAEASGLLTPVSFTVTATDVLDGDVTPVCAPASGSDFGLGTTPVVCTATDSNGNESTLQFDVVVEDTTPPEITSAPGNQTLEATSPAGAVATFDFQATDIVELASAGCDAVSGSVFAFGSTLVSCTASDGSGNSSVATFTITVQDTTAPVITAAPPSATFEATGPAGASVTWIFDATDAGDAALDLSCTPPQGVFAIGTTPVVCTASDDSGNSSSVSFSVTVEDTTPPVFVAPVPVDISVPADLPAGAVVNYTQPVAEDLVDTDVTVVCTPPSGSTFALGDTTVTCTATDDSANSAETTFTVSVVDGTAPVITFASDPFIAYADSALGAVVDFSGNITVDDVDPSPSLVCTPASGSQFGFGLTAVSCTATDASGNVGNGSFDVSVQYLPLSGLDNNFPKAGVNTGSSVGLAWTYQAPGGSALGSGDIFPLILISGPLPGVNNCNNPVDPDPPGTPLVVEVEDPGDSRLRYQNPNWRFNWQTVDENGADLSPGCYNIRIGAYARNPMTFPGEPPIQIDGPFIVKLK